MKNSVKLLIILLLVSFIAYSQPSGKAAYEYKLLDQTSTTNRLMYLDKFGYMKPLGIGTNGQIVTTFNNTPTWKSLSDVGVESVGSVQSKFLNLYKKIYNGVSFTNQTDITQSTEGQCQINYGRFGDSMAGYKGTPFYQLLTRKFGKRGSIYMNTPEITGNGYYHTNTGENQYWFTGAWAGITGGNGTITYNLNGGAQVGNQLKVYYIKNSNLGRFKVQISTTGLSGTYSDVSGYTDIDCYSSSLSVGILTIPTANGNVNPKIVGISGDVIILFTTLENTEIDGVMFYDFGSGGLNWDKANTTPSSIITPVFADIKLDLSTLEFKEGNGEFIETNVYPWLNTVNAAYTKNDWVLIGSSPQQTLNDDNISANAALKKYADLNGKYYFDGYSPLIDYNKMVDLGWNGDGLHLNTGTGLYLSNILFSLMGLNTTYFKPITNDTKNSNSTTAKLEIKNETLLNKIGTISGDGIYDQDMIYKSKRWHTFQNLEGYTLANLSQWGEFNVSNSYYLNDKKLLISPFSSGWVGSAGTIPVSQGSTSEFQWKSLSDAGIAPSSGSTNYIQASPVNPQTANISLNGSISSLNLASSKSRMLSASSNGTLTAISDGLLGQALTTDGNGTYSFSTISGYTDAMADARVVAGITNKVDKVSGKSLVFDTEISKIHSLHADDQHFTQVITSSEIQLGLSNSPYVCSIPKYTHPATHPASIITQDASNRFVTDTQISSWSGKQNAIATGTTAQYFRGDLTLATFPTIPAAQVQSDWNATTGVTAILNKPSFTAFGNVFKVNTPIENQIGIWTGDGTLKGSSDFSFDGSDLLIKSSNSMSGITFKNTSPTNSTDAAFITSNNDALSVMLFRGGITYAAALFKTDGLYLPTIAYNSPTTEMLYYNNSTGLITRGAAPSGSGTYTLPTASTTTLGGVKVDGTTINISGGVISSSGSSKWATGAYGIGNIGNVGIGSTAYQNYRLAIHSSSAYNPAQYIMNDNVNGGGTYIYAGSTINEYPLLVSNYNLTKSLFQVRGDGTIKMPNLTSNQTTKVLYINDLDGTLYKGDAPTGVGVGDITSVIAGTGLSGGTYAGDANISIANTGVAAGSYTNANITINAQGQITVAENGNSGNVTGMVYPTGTGIPLVFGGTSWGTTIAFNGNTSTFLNGAGAFSTPSGAGDITGVTAGVGLSGGGLSGDVTLNLANTTVTPGSYTNSSFTVDSQGRITSASSGSGSGTVTSVGSGNGMNFTPITGSGNVTLGTPTQITSSSTDAVTATSHSHSLNDSGVSAGSYANANITVDAKGRITSASNGSDGGTNYWQQLTGAVAPATITNEVRIGSTSDFGDYKLQTYGQTYLNYSAASSGSALYATSNGSYAAQFDNTVGTGILVNSVNSTSSIFQSKYSTTNTSEQASRFVRMSSGTPVIGIGSHISFYTNNSVSNTDISEYGKFGIVSTNITQYSESGDFVWSPSNSGSLAEKMRLISTGRLKLNSYGSGIITGTPASYLFTDSSGNVIEKNTNRFQLTSGNSYTLNTTINIHGYASVAGNITVILSNLTDGMTGNIEITYTGASVVTFNAGSSNLLYVSSNIYNTTTNNYTKSVISQSTGTAVYSYYVSGTHIYLTGTQLWN